MNKRVLSILLSIVMLIGMLPTAVFSVSAENESFAVTAKMKSQIEYIENMFNTEGTEEFIISWMADENYLSQFPVVIPEEMTALEGEEERITADYSFLLYLTLTYTFRYAFEQKENVTDTIRCILDHFVPLKEDFFGLLDIIKAGCKSPDPDMYAVSNELIVRIFRELNELINCTFGSEDEETDVINTFYRFMHDELLLQSETVSENADYSFDAYKTLNEFNKVLLECTGEDCQDIYDEWVENDDLNNLSSMQIMAGKLFDRLKNFADDDCADSMWESIMLQDKPEQSVWNGYSSEEKAEYLKNYMFENNENIVFTAPVFDSLASDERLNYLNELKLYLFDGIIADLTGYLKACNLEFDGLKSIWNDIIPLLYSISDFLDVCYDEDSGQIFELSSEISEDMKSMLAAGFNPDIDDPEYDELCFVKQHSVIELYKEVGDALGENILLPTVQNGINKGTENIFAQTVKDNIESVKEEETKNIILSFMNIRVFSEQKATCTENGRKKYYEKTDTELYYSDEELTHQIGDSAALSAWLSDYTENGGGIKAFGHDWIDSGDEHICNRCKETGRHSYKDDSEFCEICKEIRAQHNTITADTEVLTEGNWLLKNDVELVKPLAVSGNVVLYLADGYTLTANKGIVLPKGNSLTVFAQSAGENTGKIVAYGEKGAAGIGGSLTDCDSGTLTVNGGDIYAEGGLGAYGIGAGFGGESGNFTKNGGKVTTVDRIPHEHTFSDKYSTNEAAHWFAATCEHSDITKGMATHTFGEGTVNGNKTTYTCTVCGYVKSVEDKAAKDLNEAKSAAKAVIDNAVKNADNDIKNYGEAAKADIDKLTTITAVTEKLEAALAEINGMKTQKAITAALAELSKAASGLKTQTAKAVAGVSEALILSADSEDEVNTVLADALDMIAAAEAEAEPDEPTEPTNPEVCSKCGHSHSNDFFGQILCFVYRVINWFKNLFN